MCLVETGLQPVRRPFVAQESHRVRVGGRSCGGRGPLYPFNTNYSLINSVWEWSRVLAIAAGTGAFDGPDRAQKIREFRGLR